ncbi:MFS transporter [Vibrio agarilyticus]|nr:MFS transporter [Vibrio agarilyticus]
MLLLLALIYLAFISLGLPDAVLGSSWPVISQDLSTSLDAAGFVAVIVSAGTVISSLAATRIIQRFGTGKVVAVSVLMTAAALLGFTSANYLFVLVLLAVPLGLGAGAVDAALNNFVALHYKSKHMNYLHSFWGVGATTGPLIMATYLAVNGGWREGYAVLSAIQFALVIVLFATLPLWKKAITPTVSQEEESSSTAMISNRTALKIKGVKLQMLVFCCYCSLEAGTGLWAASYLTTEKGMLASDAAFWTAMYFLGITIGRFLCGMIADRFDEAKMIRYGAVIILLGVIGVLAPLPMVLNQWSLVLIGLGCAPIYPNTIHLTPKRFGAHASQAVIALSMATAYTGTTLVPPMMGFALDTLSFAYFPFILLLLSGVMLALSEKLNAFGSKTNADKNSTNEAQMGAESM